SSAPATGLVLTDTMPAGVTFISVSSTSGNCSRSGSSVTCSMFNLGAGASATITLVVTPQSAGTITNQISAVANEPELDSSNNSSSESTTVTPATDLKVTVNDGKSSSTAGAQNTYSIVVTNAGPMAVTGASITDPFPSRFTGVTFTATQVGGAAGF